MKKTPLKRRGRRAKSWRKVLLREFSQRIRNRDQHCLKGGPAGVGCGGPLQCSHILPIGSYPSIALHPKNAIALCYKHHLHWWHKDPISAIVWLSLSLESRHLDELEDLRRNSLEYKKLTEADWRDLWGQRGL